MLRLRVAGRGAPSSRNYTLQSTLDGAGVVPPGVPLVRVPRGTNTAVALASFLVQQLRARGVVRALYGGPTGPTYLLVFQRA
jgi:hypothetical protein